MKWILIVVAMLITGNAKAFDFGISTADCNASNEVKKYAIYKNNPNADYSIHFTKYIVPNSLDVEIVNDPHDADIIFTDDMSNADIYLCRVRGRYAEKTVSIDDFSKRKTRNVRIITMIASVDIKLYYNSRKFSLNEAIALIAAFLKIHD